MLIAPATAAQAAALIQMTLVPVIMISAVGLVCLVVQNRHAVVVDRIYRLNRERLQLLEELRKVRGNPDQSALIQRRVAEIGGMSRLWLRRGANTRAALASAFLGILLFGLTSLWLVIGALLGGASPWYTIGVAFFVGGMVAFLAGFAFVLVDLQQSLGLSHLDTDFVDHEVDLVGSSLDEGGAVRAPNGTASEARPERYK